MKCGEIFSDEGEFCVRIAKSHHGRPTALELACETHLDAK